jgi:hypothetical protein
MKQLQAGNISGAATILANQAEGSIAGATTLAIGKAEALTGVAREKAAEWSDEPLTLTDEEEIEMTIGADTLPDSDSAAAGLSDTLPPAV